MVDWFKKDRVKGLKKQLSVLKIVQQDYQGKTIDNIIVQVEARIKEEER